MRYTPSKDLTVGVELELQLINPKTCDLSTSARSLIKGLENSVCEKLIKPEITQSMLEINSSVHQNAQDLFAELKFINKKLLDKAENIGILLCGGGVHPFQKWKNQKIYPTPRFIKLYEKYGYLAKRFTIFGQHIHVGCSTADRAVYLTLVLSRYVPHFIALTASSPFYQGVDTGFDSSRVSIVNAFPLSGVMPYYPSWEEFSAYFEEMQALNIIKTMKDFYWDIRPKPEIGTVEVRICDTPLSIETATMIAAYIQALTYYIFENQMTEINEKIYFPYKHNRFQASRHGFSGRFINPYTKETKTLQEDMLETIDKILPYAQTLKSENILLEIKNRVIEQFNDASRIRRIYSQSGSLEALVKHQAIMWSDMLIDCCQSA
jgi:carboxylate-amine ligase